MKKAYIITPAIVIGLVFCILTPVTFAYFSAASNDSAHAQTATVNVAMHENFPQTDEFGAPLSTVKTVYGENTGSSMAYVRALIIPAPEYRYVGIDSSNNPIDEWRPLALPLSALQINVSSTDWVADGDYLYYSKILNPQEVTTSLKVSVQLKDPSALPAKTDVRLNLRVELQSAQASNNAYATVFGINQLPAGVETIG